VAYFVAMYRRRRSSALDSQPGSAFHQLRCDDPVQWSDHRPHRSGGEFASIVQASGQYGAATVVPSQIKLTVHERPIRRQHDFIGIRTRD
jgi:hypothetical protein